MGKFLCFKNNYRANIHINTLLHRIPAEQFPNTEIESTSEQCAWHMLTQSRTCTWKHIDCFLLYLWTRWKWFEIKRDRWLSGPCESHISQRARKSLQHFLRRKIFKFLKVCTLSLYPMKLKIFTLEIMEGQD